MLTVTEHDITGKYQIGAYTVDLHLPLPQPDSGPVCTTWQPHPPGEDDLSAAEMDDLGAALEELSAAADRHEGVQQIRVAPEPWMKALARHHPAVRDTSPFVDDDTIKVSADWHDEDELPEEQDIKEALQFTLDIERSFAGEAPQAVLAEIQQDLHDNFPETADCPRCMAYMLCLAGILLMSARQHRERELASLKAIKDAVTAERVRVLDTMPAALSRGLY